MKKFLFTVIIAITAMLSMPAFADYQKQYGNEVIASYGSEPTAVYSGDTIVAIKAKTSDSVKVAGGKTNNLIMSNLDSQNNLAVKKAFDSMFLKYEFKHIKNTEAVFNKVIDAAKVNVVDDDIKLVYAIQLE
jgi:hypothetical protein